MLARYPGAVLYRQLNRMAAHRVTNDPTDQFLKPACSGVGPVAVNIAEAPGTSLLASSDCLAQAG